MKRFFGMMPIDEIEREERLGEYYEQRFFI